MIDPTRSKADLRKQCFARRQDAHDQAANAAMAARDHLLASRWLTGRTTISAYCAMRSEIDPAPLIHALFDAGHRMCLPIVMAPKQPLQFREWTPETELETGDFGALIPVSGEWLVPELLIVPLLAFDARGWRLGYGGGFYDRTLEGLRALHPTPALGYAYAAQQVDAVPIEPTDQPLDAVVTEQGVLKTDHRGVV